MQDVKLQGVAIGEVKIIAYKNLLDQDNLSGETNQEEIVALQQSVASVATTTAEYTSETRVMLLT